MVCGHVLRPTFAALVAAEEELGPLFALVERAASGTLKLSEMVALFWHCLAEQPKLPASVDSLNNSSPPRRRGSMNTGSSSPDTAVFMDSRLRGNDEDLNERLQEREAFSEAVAAGGLAAATPALKILLGQILGGR
jgi:Phage tail tube protein, GTA-gp10